MIVQDQHNRDWFCTMEKETMAPTGVMIPQFTAPWYPDQKYIRPGVSPDGLRGDRRNPGRIFIDYNAMAADHEAKLDQLDHRLRTLARKYYPGKLKETLENPPEDIMDALYGPRGGPPPPVEFIWAAQDGNRWVLGFTEAVPQWAKPFVARLDTKTRDRREGRSFADEDEDAFEPVLVDAETAPARRGKTTPAAEPEDPEIQEELVPAAMGGVDPSWQDPQEIEVPKTSGGRTKARRE